jgi:hypothetical protein
VSPRTLQTTLVCVYIYIAVCPSTCFISEGTERISVKFNIENLHEDLIKHNYNGILSSARILLIFFKKGLTCIMAAVYDIKYKTHHVLQILFEIFLDTANI